MAVKDLLIWAGHHEELAHHSDGRPYLVDAEVNVSISHAGNLVALGLDSRGDIGVDVERLERNFSSVATLYLSKAELGWMNRESSRSMALAWCAKESIYKLPWQSPKDAVRGICLMPFAEPAPNGRLEVRVDDSGEERPIRLSYQFLDGFCLTWASRTPSSLQRRYS